MNSYFLSLITNRERRVIPPHPWIVRSGRKKEYYVNIRYENENETINFFFFSTDDFQIEVRKDNIELSESGLTSNFHIDYSLCINQIELILKKRIPKIYLILRWLIFLNL
jgi:hypothetical protein